jgi:hypothetical protein
MSETPGNPGGFAQVLCQIQGLIWEIRGQARSSPEVLDGELAVIQV